MRSAAARLDELRPITELTEAAVFRCTCNYSLAAMDLLPIGYEWLYWHPPWRHSLMYRQKREEVCGVLDDFDLVL